MTTEDASLRAALVEALPDPAAEIEYRRQIAAEEYARGLAAGRTAGYLEAVTDIKAAEHGIHRILARHHEVSERRWHVCCLPCRRRGHRVGCTDCQARTRATFGEAAPGEPGPAGLIARARASWEALGLSLGPGPGWVHLGGRFVHWHRPCTSACNYEPGWYRIADAISIIERLPADYTRQLDELRAEAAATSERRAA